MKGWKGIIEEAEFSDGHVRLNGTLSIPDGASAIIVFAHGSGSSRLSPRNKYVADRLNRKGFATFLVDLLTTREETVDLVNGLMRFNVQLLGDRLLAATAYLMQLEHTRLMRVGYFGASTGGAAALIAAAELPRAVQAVVCRGGRPDLADPVLHAVEAPTLLIVGELDSTVIEMNKYAATRMRSINQMNIIAKATHLFEEPGALDMVADQAINWFERYLMEADQRRIAPAS